MMSKILPVLILVCGSYFFAAAQLPKSNVYLFDLRQVSDSTFEFSKPRYLTHFNSRGYNNQPAFFSNNELYLSLQMPYESQPDLYLFDLDKKTKTKVTETVEGEFSPSRMPDYYNFSAIRQEFQGRDTLLRLWQFPIDRLSNGKPVFKYLTGIGYYNWINGSEVAVFIVDNPSYLAIADTRTDDVYPIATNVGRCFQKLSNGSLVYVQKSDSGTWLLMEKNLYNRARQPTKITTTLTGSEDFVVLPDGTFLMGKGSRLYKFNRFSDEEWVEVADFRYYDIRNISRLALSPDYKLAVVAE